MENVYLIQKGMGCEFYAVLFDEVDSKWHIVDFDKSYVRWKDYNSVEEAEERFKSLLDAGLIDNYIKLN